MAAKLFEITWTEEVEFNCYVEIEAETKEEALAKWNAGEYTAYDRDETTNSFVEDSEEIFEVGKKEM